MIKAYLAVFPSYYEGEDMETRFVIYKNDDLIDKKAILDDYNKPAICALLAVENLLNALKDFKDEGILLVINDGGLYELLMGISMTDKRELLYRADKTRDEMLKFSKLEIKNVSGDHLEIEKWDKVLTFS